MKNLTKTFLITIVILSSCKINTDKQNENINKKRTSNTNNDKKEAASNNDSLETKPTFPYKYKNIRDFSLINKTTKGLIKIDSHYHDKIIRKVAENYYDYSPELENYYFSEEGQLGNIKLSTVKLFWDSCSEFIYLLITDKQNNLITSLPIEEWKTGCEGTSEFYTKFINDSTVNQTIEKCFYGSESEECQTTSFNFVIKKTGNIDTILFEIESN